MSQHRFFLQFKLLARSLITLVLLGLSSTALATVPTAPGDQCQVILRYEGICGNQRSNRCTGYATSEESQRIWNDYVYLCVYVPGASSDRYSHECIDYLGIGSTCHSTVPDLIEYHVYNPPLTVMPLRDEPRYTVAPRTVRACTMLSDTGAIVRRFHEACGNVSAGACSNPAAPVADFQRACGTKNPCDCVDSYGCSADYCQAPVLGSAPGPVAPGTGVGPTSPTEPGPGTPGAPPPPPPADGTTPEAPAPGIGSPGTPPELAGDPNFVLGSNSGVKSNPPENAGKTGSAETGGSGCSLQTQASQEGTFGFWLLFGVVIPILGFRGRFYLNSLSQR
ncbi:MAG: hypothetical protein K8R69_03180 [Deltaproteobacteria bacterium]|nr:hypothetical protein [Deltaproteobacteria bacterium]